MATEFPAHLFRMSGSPEAIRTAQAAYRRFGQSSSAAADRITGMDTGQFIGPEGDQFREKVDSEIPPHLRVTGEAFTKVATALGGFASQLTDLQGGMRPVADQAPAAWERLQAAKTSLADAQAADQHHARAQQQAMQQHQQALADAQARNQPAPTAPQSHHRSSAPGAQAELAAAQREWDALVHKATSLRSEMTAATESCCKVINSAKGMRFQEPPAAYDLIGQGRDFVREHKDVLKSISSALKVVSAAATVVGLALQAIPVVGNAVGAAFLAVGAATGVAALGIDAAVYAATGEGSLTSIMVDTALTVIPIGRLAKLGKGALSVFKSSGKAASVSDDAVRAADDVADGAGDAAGKFETIPMRDQYVGEHLRGFEGRPKPVKYLTAAQRQEHMLSVGDDGLLRTNKGELFDTSTGTSLHSQNDPRAIFVMDKHGNVFASNHQELGRFHHSSLAAGEPVAAAGELGVKDGVVNFVSNASGHYRPGKEATMNFMRHLFNDRKAKFDPDADVKILGE